MITKNIMLWKQISSPAKIKFTKKTRYTVFYIMIVNDLTLREMLLYTWLYFSKLLF